MQLDDTTRTDIRKAVEDLETTTTGELVCVIAQSSARYVLFPLLWAAAAALTLPVLNPLLESTGNAAPVTFPLQTVVFVMLALCLMYTPLRTKVTPGFVRDLHCHRTAMEQFFARRLYETRGHTGVLLFVSIEEHHAELIADTGINAKVKEGTWNSIVDALTADIGKDRVREGFIAAIGACKVILAEHFPETGGKVNELDDNPVELPRSTFIS